MPFCHKCGFKVSTWMFFCPRCGTSLTPSTVLPRRYGYRFTSHIVPYTLVWVFLTFWQMLFMNWVSHVALYSQILWIVSGMIAGLIVGVAFTLKQLKSLVEKGKTFTSISTLLFIIGIFFIFTGFFFSVIPATGFLTTTQVGMVNFVFCAGIVLFIARLFLLFEWERNHKMRIYAKEWSTRLYVVPKPDYPDNQYSIRSA